MAYINGNQVNFSSYILDGNGYYTKEEINNMHNLTWQSATLNTEYIASGDIRFCKIGNIVNLYIRNLKFTQTNIPDNAILATGLPKSILHGIFRIFAGNESFICAVNAEGNLVEWWTPDISNVNYEFTGQTTYLC